MQLIAGARTPWPPTTAELRDSNILSRPKIILGMPYLEYNLQLEPLRQVALEKNDDILLVMVEGADYFIQVLATTFR
jgi:hypothetical protein